MCTDDVGGNSSAGGEVELAKMLALTTSERCNVLVFGISPEDVATAAKPPK